jgi:hypothetical protein
MQLPVLQMAGLSWPGLALGEQGLTAKV